MSQLVIAHSLLPSFPTERNLSERDGLLAWLDFHRTVFIAKCSGLTAAQLALRSCPPSNLTLLGLLRHLTEVERGWFISELGGQQANPLYFSDTNPDGDFDSLESAPAQEVYERYAATIGECHKILSGIEDMNAPTHWTKYPANARWVITHLIEEYARHNGHADLLREAIDGSKGTD